MSMGMFLEGKGGYFRLRSATWREVLKLAYDHGWKPAGTKPPALPIYREDGTVIEEQTEAYRQAYEDWNATNYYTNDFQWVTAEDAGNIADALERALEEDETSGEGLAQSYIDYLREFITFCRAGGFTIA
jgi:hypothetical protein